MMKRVIGLVLIQLVFTSTAFAISFKSNSKFYFNDKDGEQLAYLECSNLSIRDEVALNKIIASAEKQNAEVESITVKKQKIAVAYLKEEGSTTYEFETYRSGCEMSLR